MDLFASSIAVYYYNEMTQGSCPKAHMADLIWRFLRTTGFAQTSLISIEAQGPTIRHLVGAIAYITAKFCTMSMAQAIYEYKLIGVFV